MTNNLQELLKIPGYMYEGTRPAYFREHPLMFICDTVEMVEQVGSLMQPNDIEFIDEMYQEFIVGFCERNGLQVPITKDSFVEALYKGFEHRKCENGTCG